MIHPKLSWQERVRETEKFHKQLLRESRSHTIRDTAKILHRSYGSVCEDLLLANWLKTHPKIADFKSMLAALVFIREKRMEMRLR